MVSERGGVLLTVQAPAKLLATSVTHERVPGSQPIVQSVTVGTPCAEQSTSTSPRQVRVPATQVSASTVGAASGVRAASTGGAPPGRRQTWSTPHSYPSGQGGSPPPQRNGALPRSGAKQPAIRARATRPARRTVHSTSSKAPR